MEGNDAGNKQAGGDMTDRYPQLTEQYAPDAVILGDGDYPRHALPLRILHNARYLCCCDGAGAAFIKQGGMPHAIVGDGDSLSPTFKQQYASLIHLINEQDDNDLTKATHHCMSCGARRIAYLGATGKRDDHTIGNIALLIRYYREFGLFPVMITDFGYFTPASGTCRFDTFCGQQVSIFNFGCTELRGDGFRWAPYAYSSLWQGTLNEALGTEVQLCGNGCFLVYRAFSSLKDNRLS